MFFTRVYSGACNFFRTRHHKHGACSRIRSKIRLITGRRRSWGRGTPRDGVDMYSLCQMTNLLLPWAVAISRTSCTTGHATRRRSPSLTAPKMRCSPITRTSYQQSQAVVEKAITHGNQIRANNKAYEILVTQCSVLFATPSIAGMNLRFFQETWPVGITKPRKPKWWRGRGEWISPFSIKKKKNGKAAKDGIRHRRNRHRSCSWRFHCWRRFAGEDWCWDSNR